MEEDIILELSRSFWDNYKKFMRGEIPLIELKKFLITEDDVVFYCDECDQKCDVAATIKSVTKRNLDALISGFFSILETVKDVRERKIIARKILIIFLSNYSCLVRGKAKEKTKRIMIHFLTSFEDVSRNNHLDQLVRNLISTAFSERIKEDRMGIMNLILFKFICFYACLAVSDRAGRIKCSELGKVISSNWNNSTPESVTLTELKKRDNSKSLTSDLELLEKYSFGIKKRSRSLLRLHFLNTIYDFNCFINSTLTA